MSYGREHRLPLSAKRVSLVSAAALLGTLVLSASPGAADPDKSNGSSSGDKPSISEVKERLDTLNHQAEIASENLNTVRVQMEEARQRLSALQADVERKRSRVEALREQVVGSALADYQNGGGLSTTTSFLVADDPGAFMNGVASKAMVEHQQTGLLSKLTQQQRQLGAQEKQAQSAVAAINKDRADIAAHKQELTDRTQQAQDLLDSLEAAERARLLRLQAAAEPTYTEQPSRSVPRPPTSSVPASGRAEVAVQTALAQIGDPYVYGAAGPDAFDCSGLTMYAWNAAGVALVALVERSVDPGHTGLDLGSGAGRPGVLLLAGLARRHVHRRWQHRARPAHRDHGADRLALLDADQPRDAHRLAR